MVRVIFYEAYYYSNYTIYTKILCEKYYYCKYLISFNIYYFKLINNCR